MYEFYSRPNKCGYSEVQDQAVTQQTSR